MDFVCHDDSDNSDGDEESLPSIEFTFNKKMVKKTGGWFCNENPFSERKDDVPNVQIDPG